MNIRWLRLNRQFRGVDVKGKGRKLFKFISQKLPGRTDKNHGKIHSEQPDSGSIIEMGPPEYKAALISHEIR
jgi:hypothetical protein